MNHRSQKYRLVKYDSLIDAEQGINRSFENEGFRVHGFYQSVESIENKEVLFAFHVLFESIEPESLPAFHKCWRCEKTKPESEMTEEAAYNTAHEIIRFTEWAHSVVCKFNKGVTTISEPPLKIEICSQDIKAINAAAIYFKRIQIRALEEEIKR